MWLLVRKDLYQQRKSVLVFLVAAVSAYAFRSIASGGPLILFVIGLVFAFNMTLRSAVDEYKNNGFVFLGSLPLKRPAIVYSKFAGSLVFTALFYLLSLLANYVHDGLVFTDTAWRMSLGALLGYCFVLVLQGVFWLLFFVLDYARALSISRVLFLLPLIFAVISGDSQPVQTLLNSAGLARVVLITGVATLATYTVLMVAAVVVFNRRDVI